MTKHIALALTLGLAACTQGTIDGPSGPLQIDEHSETALSGSFDAGDIIVSFAAEMPHEYVGLVSVTVRDKTLTINADAYSGHIAFDAEGAQLTADEVAALAAFQHAIADYLGPIEDTAAMHESVLYAATPFFAAAPVDTPLMPAEEIVVGLSGIDTYSRGDDGKKCIKKGEFRTAKFDGDEGNTDEVWKVGANGGVQYNGDYSCMGRCGTGCGSYDWTLDCLDHDACSRHYFSTTGPLDHNCGDEYSNASDDYVAFWKRCRS